MLEKKSWEYRYFLTLTYDDDHLHIVEKFDNKTGEVVDLSTLKKRDLQLFMKSWRGSKQNKDTYMPKCKYFACGEYGDTTNRRHMHMILFQDIPIPDMKLHGLTRDKLPLYKSNFLDEKWGRGYCWIGEVTLESAGYVARYVTKKQTGEGAKIYDELGIEPEFVTMSNGIGMEYFQDHWQEIYRNDEIILPSYKAEPKVLKPPRRYDEKLFELDPTLLQHHKDQRRANAIAGRNSKQAQTSRLDWAEIESKTKQQRQKLLKRSDN